MYIDVKSVQVELRRVTSFFNDLWNSLNDTNANVRDTSADNLTWTCDIISDVYDNNDWYWQHLRQQLVIYFVLKKKDDINTSDN